MTSRELTWFIPGKSPIKTDTIFREIPLDATTGLRTCHYDQTTHFAVYEFWPSDLLQIFRRAGMQLRTPPAYDPKCNNTSADTGIAPQITSPQTELHYIAHRRTLQIPFHATTDGDVRKLYWFLNETFIGTTDRDQAFLWSAAPGNYIVRVIDDHGRSDARDLAVKGDIP